MFRIELKKEWRILVRQYQELIQILAFHALFLYLMRMFLSGALVKTVGIPVLWLGLTLSLLLSAEQYFEQECQGGMIYYYSMQPLLDIRSWILAKVTVRLVQLTFPLLGMTALCAYIFEMPFLVLIHSLFAQMLLAPAFILFAALGSASTLLLRRSALLTVLIILPLQIPLIILGNSLSFSIENGYNVMPLYAMIGAITLLSITFLPFLIALLVKVGVS